MSAMRAIGAALAALTCTSAGLGQGQVELMDEGGTSVRLLEWTVEDGAAVLRWPDGTEVAFGERENAFWTAPFPTGRLPDWALDADELAVRIDGVDARMPADGLYATTFPTADGVRWALADAELSAPLLPPAPLTLRVPESMAEPGAESEATTGPSAADERPRPLDALTPAERLFGSLSLLDRSDLHASLDEPPDTRGLDLLEAPNTINTPLARMFESGPTLRFLQDVEWRFQTFERDGDSGLGLAFDYSKTKPLSIKDLADGRGVEGHALDLRAEGHLAFDNDINPSDFTSYSLGFEYFRSTGGAVPALTKEEKRRAQQLVQEATEYETWDEVARSGEWREFKDLARRVLSTQVYWELGLNAALEGDQDMTERNFVLGAHAALDVKAWNDRSNAALLNLFDYPAAILRLLTGYDETLLPRGNTIPTVLIGLDTVSPDGDTPRAEAGDSSNYERVRLELAYKAPIGIVDGKEYALTALYRKYFELDASDDVKGAGLDEYQYFTLGLETNDGLFATYSNGQLPFDDDGGEFYEIGWKFGF
ncbi:MAG: hypothetical protein GY711_03100 [bacterium]|nr:hypothetical protein [bacterium]